MWALSKEEMKQSGQKMGSTGIEQWADIPENVWAGAGAEWRAGVTKIGLSTEQQIGRSRSTRMLWR